MTDPTTTPTPTPSNGAAEAAPTDARAALVAELEALGADGLPAPASASETPAEAEAEGEAPEPAEGEESADEAADEPEDEPADEAEAADEADEADPELAKRIEAIQRAERRSREQLEQARAEFQRERQELEQRLAPQRDAVARYEAAAKRAKYDPVGALAALGLGPDDFEAAARQVYAASTAAAGDPKLRDQAARTMREREAADELGKLRKEQEAIRAQIEADRSQRELDAYLDTVNRSVSDATPLVSALVTNDPSGARAELARVAEHLFATTGEVPDPGDVAAELEKTERARLKRLGIEAPATARKAAAPKATPAAGEAKTGKTITSNMAATPATPRHEPASETELREDILANWPT